MGKFEIKYVTNPILSQFYVPFFVLLFVLKIQAFKLRILNP